MLLSFLLLKIPTKEDNKNTKQKLTSVYKSRLIANYLKLVGLYFEIVINFYKLKLCSRYPPLSSASTNISCNFDLLY